MQQTYPLPYSPRGSTAARRRHPRRYLLGALTVVIILIAALEANSRRGIGPHRWKYFADGASRARFEATAASYRSKEGAANRGALFEQLLVCLNDVTVRGERFGREQVDDYLGPPERASQANGVTSLEYFYDKSGTKDWVALVQLQGGKVMLIGFNDRRDFYSGGLPDPGGPSGAAIGLQGGGTPKTE